MLHQFVSRRNEQTDVAWQLQHLQACVSVLHSRADVRGRVAVLCSTLVIAKHRFMTPVTNMSQSKAGVPVASPVAVVRNPSPASKPLCPRPHIH